MWSMVKFYMRHGSLHSTYLNATVGEASHRKNIEEECEAACKIIETEPNRWIKHTCNIRGCKEGYVTVDGNEKLKRPICAAPHNKEPNPRHMPQIVGCCKNTHIYGNSAIPPSKYCQDHDQKPGASECTQSHVSDEEENRNDIPPFLQGLPSSDSGDDPRHLVGCKKQINIKKYYNTTAGTLALIRPCGIVVACSEMYTSESATQVFLFLLTTFCKPSQDASYFQHLKYLGYDRACDLHPYLQNQVSNGSAGAKILVDNVKFVVDKFHCHKHTEPCCMPLSNPECKYNPDLPEFQEIHGANTESCEQGFFRLNKYKHATKHMTRYKRMFFFNEINFQFNELREKELMKQGKM